MISEGTEVNVLKVAKYLKRNLAMITKCVCIVVNGINWTEVFDQVLEFAFSKWGA